MPLWVLVVVLLNMKRKSEIRRLGMMEGRVHVWGVVWVLRVRLCSLIGVACHVQVVKSGQRGCEVLIVV